MDENKILHLVSNKQIFLMFKKIESVLLSFTVKC